MTAGFEIFAEWSATSGKDDPDVTEQKWASLKAPFAVGWPYLANLAAQRSAGFNKAGYDFDPIVGDSGKVVEETRPPDSMDNMFQRYAWVEGAKRAVDLMTGELLDQEQFEFRVPPMVVEKPGKDDDDKPTKVRLSPWKVFKEQPKHRKSYKNLTCRFGGPLEVMENLPDLEGLCLNVWRAPKRSRPLPDTAADRDIGPFLRLAAHVIPSQFEREHVFNFMAHTLQFPGEKINHALVLGSRCEGVGKDTLFEPLRAGVGRKYVREIGPPQLTASFNKWMVGCKLVFVQEMHNFERRATMNLLKPLVAAPPDALSVNLKGVQEFFVPNLLSTVFFTNETDALAISNGDRRYFITWNDGDPMSKAAYDEVWNWLRAGGTETVIRWLLLRDISEFDAKGRAPETAAKEDMRKETRAPLQEWIEEGIANADFPFDRDLVLAEEVLRSTPDYAKFKGQLPSPQKVGKILKRARAVCLTGQMRIEGVEGTKSVWSLRRHEMYAELGADKVRALFVKQRAEAEARMMR
jgi:hypothetical protein